MSPAKRRALTLYRASLGCYPPEFRQRYADAMVRVLADAWDDRSRRRGPLAAWWTWFVMLVDALFHGLLEYLRPCDPDLIFEPSAHTEGSSMEALLRDVRYAVRGLVRRPAFTVTAVVTLAVAEALTFHQGIGARRKQERLIALRNYWVERLLRHDCVRMNTSLKPGFACGIANVEVQGVDTKDLAEHLWKKHRILVVAINHDDCRGLRVSPSVYTTFQELDRFCEAVEDVISNGLPG